MSLEDNKSLVRRFYTVAPPTCSVPYWRSGDKGGNRRRVTRLAGQSLLAGAGAE
jgi:hypothetical protein